MPKGTSMPHLSPPTLTHSETKAILRATASNPRDHLIYSLALGTGLRLAEIVGLVVGDVYTPEGRPRNRFEIRTDIHSSEVIQYDPHRATHQTLGMPLPSGSVPPPE